jgi:hypothetical protein
MSTYDQIAWLPLCGGLTFLGLVASWLAWRRRGAAAGLRGAAWSLLPLAAYLTGAIEMLWKIGSAIGDFAASFVFSPKVWAGLIVTGGAAVLFVVSGGLRRRRKAARQSPDGQAKALGAGTSVGGGTTTAKAVKAGTGQRKGSTPADDDFGEVADILRRRGIS